MSTDSWINALTHLEGRPRADEALLMLKKISSLVRPIMRSHKWMLPILAEFFPNQTNLLGQFQMYRPVHSITLTSFRHEYVRVYNMLPSLIAAHQTSTWDERFYYAYVQHTIRTHS